MSEKLPKAIFTDSGTYGNLPLDDRRPMIQTAASYIKVLINGNTILFRAPDDTYHLIV
jgi:hypothetical protein